MAGWLFMPTNRVLSAQISLVTGSAVAGYPIQNLNDAFPANQTRVTPTLGTAVIAIDVGAQGVVTLDPTSLVSGLGIKNHNLDTASIEIKSNSVASYAGSVTRLASFQLQANSNQADLLIPLTTPTADRYWYVVISPCPTPAQIGVIGLGPLFDLGYPEEGEPFDYQPPIDAIESGYGYTMDQSQRSPKNIKGPLVFLDADQTNYNQIYNRTRAGGAAYFAYDFLMRHFRQAVEKSVNSTGVRTGISAGSGIPIFYNEGANNGLSSAGRPAFYGRCHAQFRRNTELRQTEVTMTIVDQDPLSYDIAPTGY